MRVTDGVVCALGRNWVEARASFICESEGVGVLARENLLDDWKVAVLKTNIE